MASQGYAIRTAFKNLVIAAAIPSLDSSKIKLRMMTKATKGIDKTPLVVISPYGTIGDKPADFEGGRSRQYRTRIAIIDSMAGDTETNDELYSDWIEEIVNAIMVRTDGTPRTELAGVSRSWELNTEKIDTFNDPAMEQGFYAFQNAVIRCEWQ